MSAPIMLKLVSRTLTLANGVRTLKSIPGADWRILELDRRGRLPAISANFYREWSTTNSLFAEAQAAVKPRKGLLGQLRKKTGFSFANCKKALEACDYDLEAAEKWLADEAQKQGWDKATKLAGRDANQGLISILHSPSSVVMVELNCETDFVSRNEQFHELLDRLTSTLLAQSQPRCDPGSSLTLTAEELMSLPAGEDKTMKDLVALGIGSLGENLSLRRSAFLRAGPDEHLSSYVHAKIGRDVQAEMGRFAALIRYKTDGTCESHASIARRLCQHVVGMNPATLGNMEDEVVKRDRVDEIAFDVEVKEGEDEWQVSPDQQAPVVEKDTRLLFQEFILDPSLVVKEVLLANGITILDFVRFQCGESLQEQQQQRPQQQENNLDS